MYLRLILFLAFFSSSINFAQSFSVGLKLESIYYSYKNIIKNSSEEWMLPIPISGYFKVSILIDHRYEAEIKSGLQLGETFTGPEYGVTLKYKLFNSLFPLITYLNHSNAGNSRTGNGTYSNKIKFIGAGIEAKLTNVFSLDLIFYKPIGEKNLEYTIDFSSNRTITTSQMESMIKLGFIFNIIL